MHRTPSTFLILWLIGYGFPGTTLTFSSRGRPPVATQFLLPTGSSWLCASTSLTSRPIFCSPNAIDAFKKVVAPAKAILGVGVNEIPPSSGWSNKDINTSDPIEAALASRSTKLSLGPCCGFYFSRLRWPLERVCYLVSRYHQTP